MGRPKAGGSHEPERLRQFVELYMTNGGNAGAAYRATHPQCKSANASFVGGSKLLRSAKVQAMLAARRQGDSAVMTRQERQAFWTAIARGDYPEASLPERRRASETLGKSQGDFVEQVEVREDVVYHIRWDDQEEAPSSPAPSRDQATRERRHRSSTKR